MAPPARVRLLFLLGLFLQLLLVSQGCTTLLLQPESGAVRAVRAGTQTHRCDLPLVRHWCMGILRGLVGPAPVSCLLRVGMCVAVWCAHVLICPPHSEQYGAVGHTTRRLGSGANPAVTQLSRCLCTPVVACVYCFG